MRCIYNTIQSRYTILAISYNHDCMKRCTRKLMAGFRWSQRWRINSYCYLSMTEYIKLVTHVIKEIEICTPLFPVFIPASLYTFSTCVKMTVCSIFYWTKSMHLHSIKGMCNNHGLHSYQHTQVMNLKFYTCGFIFHSTWLSSFLRDHFSGKEHILQVIEDAIAAKLSISDRIQCHSGH